jgi:hypothetical protein
MQLIKIERGKSRMTNYYMTANLFCGKAHIYTTLFDSFLKNCHKIPFRCLLVHHILRLAQGKTRWKSPYLDTGFLEVAKT